MRVAVFHPARTEPDGTVVPEGAAAFRVGRIEGFTNPITGETVSAEDMANALLEVAKAEHPDKKVELQVLLHNGDAPGEDPHGEGGTSTWVPLHEAPADAKRPGGGIVAAPELTAEQGQEGAS